MASNIQRSFRNSFVNGLFKIADGLIQVLSLGLLYGSFSMWHTEWQCRRNMQNWKKQKNRAGA